MNSNAHEYKVNATKVALHLLREPDIREELKKAILAGYNLHQEDFDDE